MISKVRARRRAGRSRIPQGAHRRCAAADQSVREPGDPAPDRPRGHAGARPVRRRGDLEGRAAGGDDLAGVRRRRLHTFGHRARSSTCRRSRSRSTSAKATSTACARSSRSKRCSMPIPTGGLPAHVITTVPTADRQKSHRCSVRIGFEELDPRILPDMGVKVSFLTERAPVESAAPRAKLLVPIVGGADRRRPGHRLRASRRPRRAARHRASAPPTAIRLKCSPASVPENRSSSTAPQTLKDGDKVKVQ